MTQNPNDDLNNAPSSGSDPFSSFNPADYVKKHKPSLGSSSLDDDDDERRPEPEYMREREFEEEGRFEGEGEDVGEGLMGALGMMGRREREAEFEGEGGRGRERGRGGRGGYEESLLPGGLSLIGLIVRIFLVVFGLGFCCALVLFILITRH